MDTTRVHQAAVCGLLLTVIATSLLTAAAPALAAQRTVVGELFSQDG